MRPIINYSDPGKRNVKEPWLSESTAARISRHSDLLRNLYRDWFEKLAYRKIEILSGLDALVPQNDRRRGVLTYMRDGRKVFRCYVRSYDLRDLFGIFASFCVNKPELQQFILGQFEFDLTLFEEAVTITINFSSREFKIVGTLSQLNSAVERYHSMEFQGRNGVRSFIGR